MKFKRTKIICTIGPSTESFSSIKKLHEAGMNVARLNMSHSDHKNAKKVIDRIKKLNQSIETPVLENGLWKEELWCWLIRVSVSLMSSTK